MSGMCAGKIMSAAWQAPERSAVVLLEQLGFVLPGRLIEVVTGSYYDAAMAELVFDPWQR
jgi:hypothetical protein